MKKILFILIFSFILLNIKAQTDTIPEGYVKYTPAFKFNDGIFMNFEQVKLNKPIPKSKIVTDINVSDFDFFEKIFETNTICFYDNLGTKENLDASKIWGYCNKGALYIYYNDDFNRIPVIGSLCHFISNITYTDPMYNPYDPYNSSMQTNSRTELRQYILEFETGKVFDFNYKTIEVLLMNDTLLYDEFNNLSKKKKKNQQFLYIRKYNEKHPLYLPK